MAQFDYTAKDRAGNTVRGTIEAATERAAAAYVREMGCFPTSIRPTSREAGPLLVRRLIYPIWTGVNIRMLVFFYRQLATLLGAGMPLSEALRSVGGRTGGKLKAIIAEAQVVVQRGGTLSETMSRYPRVFSRLQLALIRAGEAGGLIEQMIDRIASHLEYEIKIRCLIKKMIIYPIVILVFALLVWICWPHLQTAVNKGMWPFLKAIWPGLRFWIALMIGVLVVLKLVFQFETVRLVWDAAKIQPPVVGDTARKIAMSRFSRAMAVLYSAGMPLSKAVDVAADACANLAVSRALKCAVPAVQSGHGIADSLERTRALMPVVVDMLVTGEKTGNVDATLQKVADYMDDEADSTIHKLGIALFVLMILIAAVLIAFLVKDFYTRLYGGIMEYANPSGGR